ncbi:hypothetical protein J5N97_001003 [Dioscorea zingiberensis]|uniref:Uncharacterized protein n=1 Tax=Dioscorea zingiberensis TaxID=325984 RepID=A0A9D5BUV1_9LILI|nr:hypothetical protein J5N97_001003 [Dioscorea zingiberensis]
MPYLPPPLQLLCPKLPPPPPQLSSCLRFPDKAVGVTFVDQAAPSAPEPPVAVKIVPHMFDSMFQIMPHRVNFIVGAIFNTIMV